VTTRRPVRTLVVYAHPLDDSFVAAVRDTAVAALTDAGHDVHLLDLYAEGFDPRLTEAEHATHDVGLPARLDDPTIVLHARLLQWAQMLVLVYPTWWGTQPAILKGWFDRVWIEGVAYHLPRGATVVRPRLRTVTRVVAVTTHGSSKLVNAVQGESGKHFLRRLVRSLVSRRARVRWIALYGMDRSTPPDRQAFLDRVRRVLGG
jgi:putative NADPH-quinone reductase